MNSTTTTTTTPQSFELDSKKLRDIGRWQKLTCIVASPLIFVLCRNFTAKLKAGDLRPGVSYVVASNHQSKLDAFIELAALGSGLLAKIAPFRPMTHNMYFQHGVAEYYMLKMGAFPAKPHERIPNGLAFAKEAIENHQTVFICPEGWLTRPNERAARPGVAQLAKVPNTMVIPVRIQWKNYGRWRRTFSLTVGRPFDGSKMSAQKILDRIYELPVK